MNMSVKNHMDGGNENMGDTVSSYIAIKLSKRKQQHTSACWDIDMKLP